MVNHFLEFAQELQIAVAIRSLFILIGGNTLVKGEEVAHNDIAKQKRDEDQQQPKTGRRVVYSEDGKIEIVEKAQKMKNGQYDARPDMTLHKEYDEYDIQRKADHKSTNASRHHRGKHRKDHVDGTVTPCKDLSATNQTILLHKEAFILTKASLLTKLGKGRTLER